MKEFPANGWRITQTISALSFFFCVQARAHVYVVTDTNDTTSVTSLRGAIIDANARGGENTIILGEEPDPRRREPQREWTFYLTIQGADEDAAATGDLDVTRGRLTIVGATPKVVIDATGLGDRVFQVFSNAQLALEGITIEGGATPFNTNYSFGEPGGAIFNAGTLIMQDCVISGNSVGVGTSSGTDIDGINSNNISLFLNGGNGGGIFNVGYIELDNCVISSNSTGAGYTSQATLAGINGGDGGGIYNLGKMFLNHCDVCDNLTGVGGAGGTLPDGAVAGPPGGDGGNGAGICNYGEMQINVSTINGNLNGTGGIGGSIAEGFISGVGGGGFGFVGGAGGSGAGIFNAGRLVLNSCTVSTNLSGAGGPGGSQIDGTLVIEGGPAGTGGNGAGVFNEGQMEANFCTVNGNLGGIGGTTQYGFILGGDGGAGGSGAGFFTTGTLVLDTCTISGNADGNGGNGTDQTAYGNGGNGGNGGSGGGVFNTGILISASCTIALNLTGAGGKGGFDGPVGIRIAPNSPASGGEGGSGGGIFNATNNLAVILRNTLTASNSANTGGLPGTNLTYAFYVGQSFIITNIGNPGANGVGPDLSGGFTSDGFNLIGAADGSTGFANGVLADQVGTTNAPIDPLIGPLQMNGGPTATHALLRGSPAINKGNCFGVHQDQRGEFRPFDYPGISFAPGGDGSDIGAFELHLNERFEPPRDIFDRR